MREKAEPLRTVAKRTQVTNHLGVNQVLVLPETKNLVVTSRPKA
jgi:hypothetical protein